MLDDSDVRSKRDDLVCSDTKSPLTSPFISIEESVDENKSLLHYCVLSRFVLSLDLCTISRQSRVERESEELTNSV